MNRITFVEIAGKKYPLSFSLGASKAMAAKFGSLDKMSDYISASDGTVTADTLDAISYILAVLIAQGVAYKNTFEKDLPPEAGARYEDGKYIKLSQEEIEVAVDIGNAGELMSAINQSMASSGEREIEAETKNVEAPAAAALYTQSSGAES